MCFYRERDERKREEFLKELESISKEDRVYIDESGINKEYKRDYGRSTRGNKILGSISGLKYARENFIAGKVGSRILAPFCYQGTCDTQLFNMWLKDFLIPELKPGQVVILDNASFHKSEKSQKLIEQAGCKMLFLPPYSPDLNPIELFWANFKRAVRFHLEKLPTLAQAIDFTFLQAMMNKEKTI